MLPNGLTEGSFHDIYIEAKDLFDGFVSSFKHRIYVTSNDPLVSFMWTILMVPIIGMDSL